MWKKRDSAKSPEYKRVKAAIGRASGPVAVSSLPEHWLGDHVAYLAKQEASEAGAGNDHVLILRKVGVEDINGSGILSDIGGHYFLPLGDCKEDNVAIFSSKDELDKMIEKFHARGAATARGPN